jgi:hypothetical protein
MIMERTDFFLAVFTRIIRKNPSAILYYQA